jgi:hypothetical protein
VFFVIQALGAVSWIAAFVVLAASNDLGRWFRPALWLQLVLCVAAPLVWNIGFPSDNGIEGAARILFGAPASLFNGLLGCVWAFIAGRKSGRGARTAGAFALALAACLAGWVVFAVID